jgi:hypothetical protein
MGRQLGGLHDSQVTNKRALERGGALTQKVFTTTLEGPWN